MLDMFLEPPCEPEIEEIKESDDEWTYFNYLDKEEREAEIYWSTL